MIRRFRESDLNAVMEIWLAANRQAHGFVRGQYWERNFEMVRQMLPQAEVYVALIEPANKKSSPEQDLTKENIADGR